MNSISPLESLIVASLWTAGFMVLVAVAETIQGIFKLLFCKKQWRRW